MNVVAIFGPVLGMAIEKNIQIDKAAHRMKINLKLVSGGIHAQYTHYNNNIA